MLEQQRQTLRAYLVRQNIPSGSSLIGQREFNLARVNRHGLPHPNDIASVRCQYTPPSGSMQRADTTMLPGAAVCTHRSMPDNGVDFHMCDEGAAYTGVGAILGPRRRRVEAEGLSSAV
jgi:hypothetical protein